MGKIKLAFFLFTFFSINILLSQTVEISGLVIAKDNIEGIHIINNTSQKFTTTNAYGVFKIQGKLNDTIVFSSIQYKLYTIIVSKEIIATKNLVVNLIEKVNELEEVFVGKILTGNLSSDINNSGLKRPVNFYDFGIPGNTAKPKTQNERRVFEADDGKFVVFYGLGFVINTNKIINRITGRTKMLKNRVKLEADEQLMYSIKARLSEVFFSVYNLDKALQMEFFYFCSEDENFSKKCKDKNDIDVLEYLKEKYSEYLINLDRKEDWIFYPLFWFLKTYSYYICTVIQQATFLFISGAEIALVLFIVVMVFGADKIPEIARGLGKGMKTLKNATNDIKHEITKSAEKHGIDTDVTQNISKEINKVKDNIEDFTGSVRRKL